MKSKRCWFNGAILWKDLTRFMPLMLGTGLIAAMVGWSTYTAYDLAYEEMGFAELRIEPVQVFLGLTSFLALASALCLFGYLTKKRECDAMHALPVRREAFFFTHLLAAFLQFAVPFAILYAFLPGLRGWGFQMLFTACGWLFYFGLAVFAMMLSGRRLGGLILFWLLGDLASGLATMVECLYLPQLPGLYLDPGTSMLLSPMTHMGTLDFSEGSFGGLMVPMSAYAAGGIGLLALSFILYRHRRLERAGDLLAARWLEPVFAWYLGISFACTLVSLGYVLEASVWIPLILGLAIGYFAARMLFARSVKVFSRGSLASFGVLAAVMAASMLVVSLDPMGLVQKVPAMDRIESISITDSNYLYNYGNGLTTTDPEHMEQLQAIHREIVTAGALAPVGLMEEVYFDDDAFFLTYTLKNGSTLRRCYRIEKEDQLDRIEYLISQPEYLLGTTSIEDLMDSVSDLQAHGTGGGMIHTRRSFFQVFLADCEAGNMYRADYEEHSAWSVTMYIASDDGSRRYVSIDIPKDAEATIAWLEECFH